MVTLPHILLALAFSVSNLIPTGNTVPFPSQNPELLLQFESSQPELTLLLI